MTIEKKNIWWIGPAISLCLVLGGFVAQWATMKASLSDMNTNQTKIEAKVNDNEKRLRDVETKSAVGDTKIDNISKDVGEIKKDIKTLLGKIK